ncbi:pepsin A-like [Sitodiplosis mosellana]|uniref:pepsin A-like n=1 Tax=Sitodiplosis mosellana TaxID=263140 RepID=UPI0024442DAA|nr:pepsin A-like [Sitodiplosis mosellana]
MARIAIIFLTFVCVFGGATFVKSIEEDFIRLPLTSLHSRSRRKADVVDPNAKKVNLWNDRNLQYGINITVGTPPQPFILHLDTGSADVWVPSVNGDCPYLCKAVNKYDSSKSSTYKEIPGKTFTLGYETGGLSGSVAEETISFAGLEIKNQVIGIGENQDTDLNSYPLDGIIGFPWSGATSQTDPKSTILGNLHKNGHIKKRFACLKLHQVNEQPGGELLLGGCDVEAEHWGRVYGNGYWEIPIDKVEAFGTDGNSLDSICGPGSSVPDCRATFDTGAAVIGGPSYLIDPIASKLGASKYDENINDYIVDCDDQTLGNLEFTFGKFKVVMTPGDYLSKDGNTCTLGFARLDDLSALLLGDPFLRKVTLLMNQEKDEAGLAKSNIDKPVARPT